MTTRARILRTSDRADAQPHVEIQIDGPCMAGTANAYRHAASQDARLSDDDIEVARQQAADIVQRLVDSYEVGVATGEVGAYGSGKASDSLPRSGSGECPTALLYGKVQSGKTRAMIFTAAMCLDNGFRIVVVLTSDNVELVDQTSHRFKVVDGPIWLNSNERSEWQADEQHIREHLHRNGLIVVCSKNGKHQDILIDFLRRINASDFPAVILDDEADQATPDTTRAARSRGGAGAPAYASRTHRRIVRNEKPDELGDSLRQTLRHNVYVQVTATPYALLLQRVDDPLRPAFTYIVEPGNGYTGGDWYFSEAAVQDGIPPLSFVDANESALISGATPATVPVGLQQSLSVFCLAAAHASSNSASGIPYTFLCHTSHRQQDHDHLRNLIGAFLSDLLSGLTSEPMTPSSRALMRAARKELAKTTVITDDMFDQHLQWLRRRLINRNVAVVNAKGGDLTVRPGLNFLIGGNILGRGLTLPNLLATYYLRAARAGQMDTMLQHARMFGYSGRHRGLIRVFLPRVLAQRFRDIVVTEQELRDYLSRGDPSHPVPVRVVQNLRATRRNVLDTSSLSGYRPGQQVYPMEPEFEPHEIRGVHARITKTLEQDVFRGPLPTRDWDFVVAELVCAKEIIASIRVREDDASSWDAGAIQAVLEDLAPDHDGKVAVYVRRRVRSQGPLISSGAASGDEQAQARRMGLPVLMLFEETGDRSLDWGGCPFWYPTVVFPTSMEVRIFNKD